MNNQIAMILPYFGKLPSYFQIWLDSAKLNKNTISFIILTDQNMSAYNIPSNVKVIRRSFTELCSFIANKYDFKIALDHPYKLCDFKPAYGEIFSDLFKPYKYWGFCDIDIIMGDISSYLNKYNFYNEDYDKFGCLGHFQILKNTPKVNTTYRYNDGEIMRNYRYVFSQPYSFQFDEQYSFNVLAQKNNLKICNLFSINGTPFADIMPFSLKFRRSYGDIKGLLYRYFIFDKERGLTEVTCKHNSEISKVHCMYVHLQKRKMDCVLSNKSRRIFIIPNKIVDEDKAEEFHVKKENILLESLYKLNVKLRQYKKINSIGYVKQRLLFKNYIRNQMQK